jgi:hypothetical protein
VCVLCVRIDPTVAIDPPVINDPSNDEYCEGEAHLTVLAFYLQEIAHLIIQPCKVQVYTPPHRMVLDYCMSVHPDVHVHSVVFENDIIINYA